MESRYHAYQEHRVHSLRFGHGPQLMFAFHGYADRARMFAQLEPVLAPHFTVVAIDLPFHGQTEWKADTFTKDDIIGILEMYQQEEGVKTISFLGFSFGARIVQALLAQMIEKTDRLILLAPDGIATKGLSAAIYTPMWARKLSFRLIKNPKWFMKLMTMLRNIKLLSPVVWLFMDKNLATPDRYQRTFGMWFALDHFWLRRREVNALLNSHPTRVDIFFGRKDVFVKYKKVKKLAEKVPSLRLHLLDAGHRIVGPELISRLEKVLNEPSQDA
jgi:pimeloyl-ACP methyl ester carboxylesterase